MRCVCVLRKKKDEQGSNLANKVCHWKDEMISVEIDIKITGNGCTVCRGIVTADVLELGLSRGAIAARKLEGVMWDKEHEDLYWFGPLR